MKVLYIDTETTGTNPVKHDIIQMSGFVEIDGKIRCEFNYTCQPFSFENIEPKALEVNHTTIDQLKSYPKPQEVHKLFCQVLGRFCNKFNKEDKFYIAGYNVRFDLDFLKAFFDKCGDPYFGSWFNWKCIDPMPILHFMEYQGKIKLPDYKLVTVCNHFNIAIDAHDAFNDIKATREVISKIIL